jgi:RHS repeat-associated protein
MTQRIENGITWTMTYNAENRLASMTNGTGTWLFSYDGDGKRVSHLVTEGAASTLTQYFLSGGYEVTSDTVAGTSMVKKYYALAGSTYAMSNNGVMQYLLTDHLGSVVAVTDNLGTLLEDSRYLPFGTVRSDVGSVTQTDKLFTGQKSLPNTGLMDYNARMYSPELGRFIQPDTIVPDAGNLQAWNRYSYVVNEPIIAVDPSGHRACYEGKRYRCNLSGEDINNLLTNKSIDVRNFVNNYMREHKIFVIFACGMYLDQDCGSNDNYKAYGGNKPFYLYSQNIDTENMKYFGSGSENIDQYINRITEFMEKDSSRQYVLLGHSLGADSILGAAATVTKKRSAKVIGLVLFDGGNRIHNENNAGYYSILENAGINFQSFITHNYSENATQSPDDYRFPSGSTLTNVEKHDFIVVDPDVYINTVSIFYSMILLGQ